MPPGAPAPPPGAPAPSGAPPFGMSGASGAPDAPCCAVALDCGDDASEASASVGMIIPVTSAAERASEQAFLLSGENLLRRRSAWASRGELASAPFFARAFSADVTSTSMMGSVFMTASYKRRFLEAGARGFKAFRGRARKGGVPTKGLRAVVLSPALACTIGPVPEMILKEGSRFQLAFRMRVGWGERGCATTAAGTWRPGRRARGRRATGDVIGTAPGAEGREASGTSRRFS